MVAAQLAIHAQRNPDQLVLERVPFLEFAEQARLPVNLVPQAEVSRVPLLLLVSAMPCTAVPCACALPAPE